MDSKYTQNQLQPIFRDGLDISFWGSVACSDSAERGSAKERAAASVV